MVKAKTEYTHQSLVQFARFNASKKPYQRIVYLVSEFLMLAVSCLLIFTAETITELKISIFLITPFFLLINPAILLIFPLLAARMEKNGVGSLNTYEFSEEKVAISSTLPIYSGQAEADYRYFECVYETETAFYMFVSKQQAIIMNKSDITEGSVEELQQLFRNHIPADKYIIKEKRSRSLPLLMGLLVGLLVTVVALVSVYSFFRLSSGITNQQQFSKAGMTITLTDDFYEKNLVAYTAVFNSEDIAVLAIKEEFSLFGGENFSLKEYADLIIENNQLQATVQENDGLTGFEFESHASGKDYVYFASVYKGSDAYWLLQFSCEKANYEALKPTILQYAKSVVV